MDPWIAMGGAAVAFLAVRRLAGGRRAPAELVKERIAAGAKVVDVRTPGEFASGAYRGAVNIPLATLSGRLREIPKDRPVVLYCASGMRSGSAARILAKAGYAEILNAGGLRHMPQ